MIKAILALILSVLFLQSGYTQEKKEVSGKLEVYYEDYADGSHKLKHFVLTDLGERLELKFESRNKTLKNGTRIKANGTFFREKSDLPKGIAGKLVTSEESILQLADDGQSSFGEVAFAPSNAIGEQKTLTILINFQDDPTNIPWTLTQASQEILGTVNDFIKENSSGQTWLTGAIAGWYTIPMNSDTCSGLQMKDYAFQAAMADGVDVKSYNRYFIIFPKISACGYSGMGQVGSIPSTAWFNGTISVRTVAHELGHNLGLRHSHARDCGDVIINGSCVDQSYGDTLDIMGYPGTVGHFNIFQKELLGWLSSTNIINVSNEGSYSIVPNSQLSNNAKGLKIFRGLDPVSGLKTYFYVEYRQPIGFDAHIPERNVIDPNNIFNGVTIRLGTELDGDSSYLLDMTPGSAFIDMKDAALIDGNTFIDPVSGISITSNLTDESHAEVSVAFDNEVTPVCVYADPSISYSPSVGPAVSAGTLVSYTMTVTNNESSECGSSTYQISTTLSNEWNISFSNTNLNLSPGQSGSTTISVASSTTKADGSYALGFNANNGNSSASKYLTYIISTSQPNLAPVANNDSVNSEFETSVVIDVLANDSDADGDILSISGHSQAINGTLLFSNNTFTYMPDAGFSGIDSFSYTISDGKGASATAIVNISVSAAPEPPIVIDDIKPTITITSPLSGELVSPDQILKIAAQAQDNIKMDRVEFFVNEVLVCTDQIQPYQCEFVIPKRGKDKSFVIKAVAFDSSNNDAFDTLSVTKDESTTGGGRSNGKGSKK